MLIAKRPALDKLPIRWALRSDGTVVVDLDHLSVEGTSAVPEIAAELARAMRGAHTDTYDVVSEDGTISRCYEVRAQPSGVVVSFYDYHRGITPDEASRTAEGGEGA